MRQTFPLFFFLLLFVPSLLSCSEDDEFTTSRARLLSLPGDTLHLDTLISGEGSRTYHFSLHNPNSKGLRLTRVRLDGGDESPFMVNIDGSEVGALYQGCIEVRAKDSLQLWVAVRLPESGRVEPQPVSDVLTLTLESGEEQRVVLQAYGQDVRRLSAVTLSADTTLSDSLPYHVYGDLIVEEGVTLTLPAGATLFFHDGANLVVRGTLLAEGTPERRVTLRGDRLDDMFINQPYDRIPGFWGGVRMTSTSYGNHLSWCDIHGGNYGIRCDSSSLDVEKLRLESSIVHNVNGPALYLSSCLAYCGNCQISNAREDCVTLLGGDYRFVQCTIASFFPFSGGNGHALLMLNDLNGDPRPLVRASFVNCIVTGATEDELFGLFCDDEHVAKEYSFTSCLLRTEEVTDEHFQNITWDGADGTPRGEKQFVKFDYDRLLFPFRLDSLSTARGAGETLPLEDSYPLDLDGKARGNDARPDAGCYQSDY